MTWTVIAVIVVGSIVDALGRGTPGFEAAPVMLLYIAVFWIIGAWMILGAGPSTQPLEERRDPGPPTRHHAAIKTAWALPTIAAVLLVVTLVLAASYAP